MAAPEVRIGCSGWEYRHWCGDLYPDGLPVQRWLEHYATLFDTVELNASFYGLPSATVFGSWARRVPVGFRFATKASRYLTHVRRLREPAEPLDRLWTRVRRLGPHLGPMLYQLPPRWKPNLARLDAFLEAVPSGPPQAVEFRDARWYLPEVRRALNTHRVALCLHDMPGSTTLPEPVGPFVYVRFHGSGTVYGGGYPTHELAEWASRFRAWREAGLDVWAFFNNDIGGHAFRDAARLRDLV